MAYVINLKFQQILLRNRLILNLRMRKNSISKDIIATILLNIPITITMAPITHTTINTVTIPMTIMITATTTIQVVLRNFLEVK